MGPKHLSRRQFLSLTALAGAGAALAACGATPTATPVPPTATKPPVAAPTAAPAAPAAPTATKPPAAPAMNEAPMLADMVKAGKLPALKDRLPLNPKVIKPIEKVGVYGETLNRGSVNMGDYLGVSQQHEPLFESAYPFPASGPVEPNLAESWAFNADGTQLTCNLRKGMKWSDGQPFSPDDILFLWEDVWGTKEALAPMPGAAYVEAGKPPTLAKVDDNTIKFTFHKPFYYALNNFASMPEWAWPKHYMKQFHPKYTPSATWEVFIKNKRWDEGRGKVTMQAWMLESYQADKGLKMVRNPYYWKVDTSGNQLPYIDRVVWNVIQDRPTIALKAVAGEIDVDGMWVGIPQIPLFFAEKDKRGFTLGWYKGEIAWRMLANMDHPDETIRKTLRDVNFRRAVALALDRKAINKTFYYDLATVFNACFSPATPFYEPFCATTYAAYDPAEAKKLLDQAGYKDVNNDGVRESADGKPLQLIIDVYQHDLYVPLMEMVVEQLKAVGLKAVLNIQQQDAIFQRKNAWEYMFTVGDYDGSGTPLESPDHFIPINDTTPVWHHLASKAPMSPEYAKFAELVSSAKTVSRDEMIKRMKEATKIMAEQVFMWSVGSMDRPYFIGKGVFNVPKEASRFPADTPPLRLYQAYIKR